jgi:hypothetical protein
MSVSVVDELVAFGIGKLPFLDLAPISDVKAITKPGDRNRYF